MSTLVFGKTRSKMTGLAMRCYLLPGFRKGIISMYVKMYGVDTTEIEFDINKYQSLGDFFSRNLLKDARPLPNLAAVHTPLLSPVDGTLKSFRKLSLTPDGLWVPQIKKATYYVPMLIGLPVMPKAKPGHSFFTATIYLSPKDYHHFHTPCQMKIHSKTHIAGKCLPVAPRFVDRVKNLFCVQERVVLSSTWEGGAMWYTAVAAYNVGDIRLVFDKDARSNKWRTHRLGRRTSYIKNCYGQYQSTTTYSSSDDMIAPDSSDSMFHAEEASTPSTIASPSHQMENKLAERYLEKDGWACDYGAELGEFKLGSTIVLTFEAPDDFQMLTKIGSSVKVNEMIGYV